MTLMLMGWPTCSLPTVLCRSFACKDESCIGLPVSCDPECCCGEEFHCCGCEWLTEYRIYYDITNGYPCGPRLRATFTGAIVGHAILCLDQESSSPENCLYWTHTKAVSLGCDDAVFSEFCHSTEWLDLSFSCRANKIPYEFGFGIYIVSAICGGFRLTSSSWECGPPLNIQLEGEMYNAIEDPEPGFECPCAEELISISITNEEPWPPP